MNATYKKVILRLKEVRKQKDMTYQDIVDACDAQGEAVSLSTVKRLFAKGSETGPDCRVATLNALFHAVIGTEELELTEAEEAELTDTEKELIAENAAVKAMVELRNATISELLTQNESKDAEIAALKAQLDVLQIQLTTTTDLFKLGMESLGRGVGQ